MWLEHFRKKVNVLEQAVAFRCHKLRAASRMPQNVLVVEHAVEVKIQNWAAG